MYPITIKRSSPCSFLHALFNYKIVTHDSIPQRMRDIIDILSHVETNSFIYGLWRAKQERKQYKHQP